MTAVSDPTDYAVHCGVCGRGLPSRAVFCSFCGSELKDAQAAINETSPPAATEPAVADEDESASGESFEDRLRLLKKLVEDDLITPEDYEERKRAVLDAMMGES